MAKGSRRLALGMLLLPLVYAAVLRLNVSPPLHLGRFYLLHGGPASVSIRSDGAAEGGLEHARMIMRRLVRGEAARRELRQNGVACVTSDRESDFCVTTRSVRIVAGPSHSPSVYLTATTAHNFSIRPYPRKADPLAMSRTAPVHIVSGGAAPPCDVVHGTPAVVFSTGGFAGNFFHDVNEVLIPLFLTAGGFRRSTLVVTDHEHYWLSKYRPLLEHLAGDGHDNHHGGIVVASPSSRGSSAAEQRVVVHCFPAGVVGLKYHGNLVCDATAAPGGVTVRHFRRFLRDALALPSPARGAGEEKPLLVMLSRRKSRAVLNEEAAAEVAREVGFRVEVVAPERMRGEVGEFARVVASASALAGVHGAGLTNMVFLPEGAVLLQIVPFGLEWAAKTYYGAGPARGMGLQYVEYRAAMEESTLVEEYPAGHPVLLDPASIHRLGYNVSKPIYTDGQNVRLNLPRFRGALLQAMHRLRRLS